MKYCRKCGCELRDDAAFCDKCGEKVETVDENKEELIDKKKKGSNRTGDFIKVCLGGIVILLAIIWYIDLISDNKQPNIDSTISLSEFNQVVPGMSYDEVVAVIGCEGTMNSQSGTGNYILTMMSWEGNGATGSNAVITFENGRVASKSQYGLK